jgi:GNAT superfamily N-acetyltransferase
MSNLNVRPAVAGDIPRILAFIRELALYEREPEAVKATEQDLLRDGFGPVPRFRCVMAEWDGVPAGFALFFTSYSTWRGHHGIRLEDVYVTPEMRGKGIGKALLAHLASIAVASGTPPPSPSTSASAQTCSPSGASCASRTKRFYP